MLLTQGSRYSPSLQQVPLVLFGSDAIKREYLGRMLKEPLMAVWDLLSICFLFAFCMRLADVHNLCFLSLFNLSLLFYYWEFFNASSFLNYMFVDSDEQGISGNAHFEENLLKLSQPFKPFSTKNEICMSGPGRVILLILIAKDLELPKIFILGSVELFVVRIVCHLVKFSKGS